jgi:serine/threonine protein kinase
MSGANDWRGGLMPELECLDPTLPVAAEESESPVVRLLGNRYALGQRLSAGGMGTVYSARDTVGGDRVAIKLLHMEHVDHPRVVRRFIQEARVIRSLASEHIVSVLDSGNFGGRPYFVMELLRGLDLRQLLDEQGCLPVARAVPLVLDVCRGLAAAHHAGLVHRDLKPANIFVTRGLHGRDLAKVLDFGVAKLRGEVDTTDPGTLIGTLGYMAPEQVMLDRDVDQRTDVYALGAILYEALTGERAHRGERAELLYSIMHVEPVPLSALGRDLPVGLAEVVARAMARSPDDRHATVNELALALRGFAGDAAGHPSPPSAIGVRPRSGRTRSNPSTHTSSDEVPPVRYAPRPSEWVPASAWVRGCRRVSAVAVPLVLVATLWVMARSAGTRGSVGAAGERGPVPTALARPTPPLAEQAGSAEPGPASPPATQAMGSPALPGEPAPERPRARTGKRLTVSPAPTMASPLELFDAENPYDAK